MNKLSGGFLLAGLCLTGHLAVAGSVESDSACVTSVRLGQPASAAPSAASEERLDEYMAFHVHAVGDSELAPLNLRSAGVAATN